MKNYNKFINESLRDKMIPKSEEDISKTLSGLEPDEMLGKIIMDMNDWYKPGIDKALELGADINYDGNLVLLNSIVFGAVDDFEYLYELTVNGIKEQDKRGELMNGFDTELSELNYDIIDTIIHNSTHKLYLEILDKIISKVNTTRLISTQLVNCVMRGHNKIIKILIKYIDKSMLKTLEHAIDISREMRKHYINTILKEKRDELLDDTTNESLRDKMVGKSKDEIKKKLGKTTPQDKLFYGVVHSIPWIVKIALEEGADVHVGGDAPLDKACTLGDIEIIKLLLAYGADPYHINYKWVGGPKGKEIIELLKKQEKKIYDKQMSESLTDKMTPKSDDEIMSKLKDSNTNPAELLIDSIKHGFLPGVENAIENILKVPTKQTFLDMGLRFAIDYNNLEIFKYIESKGGNIQQFVDNKDDTNGRTDGDLLQRAIESGSATITEYLINKGFDINKIENIRHLKQHISSQRKSDLRTIIHKYIDK